MLKSRMRPKVVKTKVKKQVQIPKYPKPHHDKHVRNFPHSTGLIQTSLPPRPLYSSGGGIPYLSSLESYGITNKPPYYLESLMAKTTTPDYIQPAPTPTSSVLTGGNPMSGGPKTPFPEQTKVQSVQYVDLVSPVSSRDNENQPDYVSLQPDFKSKRKVMKDKSMKDKLMERSEYRKKNNIPANEKVSPIMEINKLMEKTVKDLSIHGFVKPKPKPTPKPTPKQTLRGIPEEIQGPPEKSNELRKR
jgi:hypothetical protein